MERVLGARRRSSPSSRPRRQRPRDRRRRFPTRTTTLTLAELRWCVFEPIRLGRRQRRRPPPWLIGRSTATTPGCAPTGSAASKKTYRVKDKTAVDDRAHAGQKRLSAPGRTGSPASGRRERNGRGGGSTSGSRRRPSARRPESAGEELGRIRRWGDLIRTGRDARPVVRGRMAGASIGSDTEIGLGARRTRAKPDRAKMARFDFCETHAGRRARTQRDRQGTHRARTAFGSIRVLERHRQWTPT